MPSTRHAKQLLSLFFDEALVHSHFLHKPSIVAQQELLYEGVRLELPSAGSMTASGMGIIHAVLAIAVLCDGKTPNATTHAESAAPWHDQLFQKAMQLSEKKTGIPTLESAQLSLLLTHYLLMTGRYTIQPVLGWFWQNSLDDHDASSEQSSRVERQVPLRSRLYS